MKVASIILLGLFSVGAYAAAVSAKGITPDRTFPDTCNSIPHPVSQLAVPGGVTCLAQDVEGVIFTTTSYNNSAGAMALEDALCKAFPGIDLGKIKYGCRNNQ